MGLRVRSGGLVVLSVATAAALSLCGLGSAAVAAPAPGASWPSQVARPGAASCPAGETLIAPTSASTDALGVTHIFYKSVPGLQTSIPPSSLTAANVTPAVMADLGMDVRGTSGSSERRMVGQAINLGQDRTAPEFCHSAAPDLVNTHAYSGTWGGYGVTESGFGGAINGATGSWTVPYSSSSTPEPSAEGTWVGVGGGIAGESAGTGLIQTGTSMVYDGGFRSFWEYVGTSGCTTFCGEYSSVDAISQGEKVTGDVWWDTTTTATFLFETASGSGDWDVTNTPVNIPYDHTSAEWIDENFNDSKVDYQGKLKYYLYDDPGTVHFTAQGLSGSFAGQGAFTSPFAGSFRAEIMYTTPPAPSNAGTSCSDSKVVSYPADAANASGGGSSEIITCVVPGFDAPG